MKNLIFISAILFLAGCSNPETGKSCATNCDTTQVCCKDTLICCIDTTEKHFPCIVEDCQQEGPKDWAVYTECGICFHTDKKCEIGDTLKNFESPKHD